MSERQGQVQGLSEHELSEIRMLIEERTGIASMNRASASFPPRVREHLREKGMERGTELLRAMRKSNVEYEGLLERLLTQETSFFRYPGVYEAFEKRVLPEVAYEEVLKNPAHAEDLERRAQQAKSPIRSASRSRIRLSFADAWERGNTCNRRRRHALKHAERGIYKGRSIASVSDRQLANHFTEVSGGIR